MSPRLIAIDYDDTWTDDPELFAEFSKLAQSRGHEVICVTARGPEQGLNELRLPIPVYGTSGAPKREYMNTRHGMWVDIWIDDMPEII